MSHLQPEQSVWTLAITEKELCQKCLVLVWISKFFWSVKFLCKYWLWMWSEEISLTTTFFSLKWSETMQDKHHRTTVCVCVTCVCETSSLEPSWVTGSSPVSQCHQLFFNCFLYFYKHSIKTINRTYMYFLLFFVETHTYEYHWLFSVYSRQPVSRQYIPCITKLVGKPRYGEWTDLTNLSTVKLSRLPSVFVTDLSMYLTIQQSGGTTALLL